MVRYNYGEGPSFFTDACLSGYGFWCQNDWLAGYFGAFSSPDVFHLIPEHAHWMNVHVDDPESATNINVLELVPIWLGLKRSVHNWRDKHVVCYTDSSSVKSMINKGCSSIQECMILLRDIFWMCAINNVHLTARHIPGVDNVLSHIFYSNNLDFLCEFSLCCSDRTSGLG